MNEAEHLACLGILKCKKEVLMVSEPQQSSGLTEVGLVRASLETHALPGALDQEVTDQLAGRVPCRPTPQGSNRGQTLLCFKYTERLSTGFIWKMGDLLRV